MDIKLNHKVLKGLREGRSIPVEAMPKKLGMTLPDYQKLEATDNTVDVDFANKVAGTFRHNWSVFLLDDAPPTALFKRDHRTVENQTPTFHEETVDALEDADFVLEFSHALNSDTPLKLPAKKDIPHNSAEKLGAKIREMSGISISDQINFQNPSEALKQWFQFVESRGIHILQYPLNEKDNVRAFSAVRGNSAIIVLNSGDTQRGRIFSLLHEFCHVLLQNSGICDFHNSRTVDSEVFCNGFAASFLTPLGVVKEYADKVGSSVIISDIDRHAGRLASQLKVSPLVVIRRFNTIGLIDNGRYSSLHDRYLKEFRTRRKIKKREDEGPKGGPNHYTIKKLRNGYSYSERVFNALDVGSITTTEASHALGVSEPHLDDYRSKLREEA